MSIRSALLLWCILALALALEEDAPVGTRDSVDVTTSRGRPISIEDYITSHKLPDNIEGPVDDEEDVVDVQRRIASSAKDAKQVKKVAPKYDLDKKEPARRFDDSEEYVEPTIPAGKRPARVEFENYGDTGVLQGEGIRKIELPGTRSNPQGTSLISGVYVSAENPTTMMPILTTSREARSFDFVPVNIIREDTKDTFSSFADRQFGDLGDVSLVPAGTNSRIQVKKGPNGKDYEYEYVYYYYDEEDESKAGTAGTAVTNSYEVPSRPPSSTRRGASSANSGNSSSNNSNRAKYGTVERSSTVEPASNEVLPNRNDIRGRQLDVSEERLPTNTRFPPRSRSNHNTGTTEPSRARGNRPRPSLDLVDSSSFRTHQEGPEFPQTLPKGPVRFLGVTPNEDSEEKVTRGRTRPQRVQEPAPVEESVDDSPAPTTRRRPLGTAAPEAEIELHRGQPARSTEVDDDETETSSPLENLKSSSEDKKESEESASISSTPVFVNTDNPTTEYPSAMDKVALDLYAFLQQGQSNLVDASSSESNNSEATTLLEDEATTDFITTTESSVTTSAVTEPTTTSTSTTTEPTTTTTTTTTTTEAPTTTVQLPVGRGKFRRPGVASGGAGGSRNRFKSNGAGSSTTEASPAAEPTQRVRGRFGGNGGGFKRPRPGSNKHLAEEDAVHKETAAAVSSSSAERSSPGRVRFRGPAKVTTTAATPTATSAGLASGAVTRPAFNKLNINRRRGRPTTPASTATSEEKSQEASSQAESAQTPAVQIGHEPATATPKSTARARLPGAPGVRPVIRPGQARVNLRPKPGQATSSTTPHTPEAADAGSVEEPAGEGTEEETHEAPAETSPPPSRSTTVNPLTKLRNRNRLQVHPKASTKAPTVALAARRSPLLPRRKVTEAPIAQTSQEETAAPSSQEENASGETEATEAVSSAETSTAASTKHEETRGLSSLLAPRRRIAPRRPGQILSRE